MRPDLDALAAEVVRTLSAALAPVQATLAAVQGQVRDFEARWSDLGALRERVAVVESKVDHPVTTVLRSDEPDLSPVLERLSAAEARLAVLGDLRDRVVTVETKQALPAPVVELRSEPDLSPVLERLSAAEARLAVLGDLRDRVVTVETKQASPAPVVELRSEPDALIDLRARLSFVEARVQDDALTKELGTLRERVAVVEVRPSLPGPPGEPGLPGKDGADGVNGKDGTAGLSFEGVYQDGKSYEFGHLVTWAGSSWHCNEPTTTKPGDGSKAWTLMVKRGRDGKDGLPGADGKHGRDLTEKQAWR